tara:strand:+ start:1047 stop:1568 length:522 start_codon:yes stop_codon:yes gene_type:complete
MAQGFSVTFKNADDAARWVNNLKRHATRAFDNALTDVAHAIEAQAVKNTLAGFKSPHGLHGGAVDSGRLASGFTTDDKPMKKVVGNRVRYAGHMEYGTGPAIGRPPYRPPEKRVKGWSEAKGKEPEDVANSIHKFGTQPRRMLGRAVGHKKRELGKHVAKNLAKLARLGARVP